MHKTIVFKSHHLFFSRTFAIEGFAEGRIIVQKKYTSAFL